MTFDEHIGMQDYADDGAGVIAVVHIQPHHCNPTGNINGGLFLSMADVATGAAGRAYFK